ncbi:MAG: hypothetical protein JW786_01410 [Desulfobacterales bacterium]|nr:hypothetical protein [Desulfobacterales bacterium]
MKPALVITYWMSFFFYAAAFGFSLLRKKKAENSAAFLGSIVNAIGLAILSMWSGQAPVFQLYESLIFSALILFGVGICCSKQEEKFPNVRIWIWLEILLLLGIAGFAQKAPSIYLYDHNYHLILLFQILRIAVVPLTLFSSALYIQSRFDIREGNTSAMHRAHQGRNFLIISSMLFLTAEYIGIHWCLRGWGDFWQWSAGFFQSTLIVLFFMLAIHIPGSNHRPGNWRPRIGILSGFLILFLTVIRSVF